MSGGHTCALCLRLRFFLSVAGALIAGLYLQPGWATALARLMPSPLMIGIGICIAAVALFALRLWRHSRAA
jgi:hypothetical protein